MRADHPTASKSAAEGKSAKRANAGSSPAGTAGKTLPQRAVTSRGTITQRQVDRAVRIYRSESAKS